MGFDSKLLITIIKSQTGCSLHLLQHKAQIRISLPFQETEFSGADGFPVVTKTINAMCIRARNITAAPYLEMQIN